MASTFRVATLETAFTADTSGIDAAVKSVRGETDALDGQVSEAQIVADATEALRDIADLQSELDDVDRSRTEAEVQADVDDALRESERLQDQLREIDGEDVDIDIEIEADKVRRQLGDASDGLGEFRDESNQIAKESATSFTGEWEDVTDVFRDLAANAFSGFGPAGVAAGVAIAAGLGVAIAAAQDLADENTEAKESAGDIATGYVDGLDDASERFRDWATEVQEDKAWTFWQDEATTNIQQVSQDLQALGEDGADAIGAIASGSLPDMQDSLLDVNRELDGLTAKLRASSEVAESGGLGGGAAQLLEMADATERATGQLGEFTEADNERRRSLERAKEVLEAQIGTQEDAEEIAVALIVAQEGLNDEEAEYELRLRRANGEIETRNDLNQSQLEAGLDLADGLADLTDKEDDWKATLDDGTRAGRDNIREIVNLTDDISALGDSTLEQTGSQEKANEAVRKGRRDLLDQAEAAGHDRGEVRKLIDEILDIPDKAETDVTADTRDAKRESREARRYINDLHAEIDVAADTGSAYAQANAVQRYISGLNATMDVYSRPVAGPNSVGGGPTFADGGFYEDHTAQIAAPGEWRVWAEPETGGEAYIPLSPAKRGRSMDILAEVADRFGAVLTTRANGAVDAPTQAQMSGQAYSGPASMSVTVHATSNDPEAIARAVADEWEWEYRR
ncbi:hypothetical protein UQW22_09865 [Isoptericola halotolerans]|uniref:hypothetical protein n=1 Tax=Isoptericola halotolerans TaxID=300560 RepID=UPI00389058D9